ncbi:fungal-specific transcription factor domain-containing protein [Mycena alexandri]|uniref:Fungal-specific transcription factor domain-containing protein n=1 Tax=Mycena alexandri TaxID=1745969 RepID=A0AAD6WLZ8_9AGAR|nr:fungal-specific transcription factor domain-containing protein [Mycena alexandri]
MPAAPKSPPQSRKPGAPKAKGAVRAKSGCYTCRIRRKKCDEQQNADGHCETCVRLRLECLGFGAKRPPWLRENRNVSDMRDKIKSFLAAQGMIKGHSGAGPRGAEHDSPILRLNEDSTPSSSESPPTPTLSLSPSEPPRALQPHQSAIREERSSWLVGVEYPHMHPHIRAASPFDHEGSSHSSHTDLYPASYNPNSIAPWDAQTAQHHIVQTVPEFRPQFSSLFSPTYHRNYDDELYYQTPILEDVPTYNIYLSPRSGGQMDDELVTYYLRQVMDLQYLLADSTSIRSIIFPSVTTLGPSRDAAHTKKHYDEVLKVLKNPQRPEDDALAAISVISSFLFDGGIGDWQEWLYVSYDYVHSILRGHDARDTLQTCPETTRFIIKAVIWFDVLAAITTQDSPQCLGYIRKLYSPDSSMVYDPTLPASPELSMLSMMGCENHIVWVLAEASALSVWKREQLAHGRLSVPDLVSRANDLDAYLTTPSTLSSSSSSSSSVYPDTPPAHDTDIARTLTSNIFRTATRVYLRSIVSGDFPHVPEIAQAIDETMGYVRSASTAPHSLKVHSSVVRSTVFAFFICGALTDNAHLRHEVYEGLGLPREERAASTVGNSGHIRKLLQTIWAGRTKNTLSMPVRWRDVLKEAKMLVV